MNRYLIRFSRQGLLRYTSHLDLMRLFQRALKRSGIRVSYSTGFNPHPKMSFAQPLSLGYTSRGEYLEIQCDTTYDTAFILSAISPALPEGILATACRELPAAGRSMASLVRWAAYTIRIPGSTDMERNAALRFMEQPEIRSKKRKKSTGALIEIDIKPMVRSLDAACEPEEEDGTLLVLHTVVRAGSEANLNPDLLVRSFLAYCGSDPAMRPYRIERTELYGEEMVPLADL